MPRLSNLRRRADPDAPRPAAIATVPTQITFRHMPASPAVAARIERETGKLLRYFQPLTHCHVVVVAPHRHHRFGRAYALHLEVGVPGGPLIVNHEPAARGHPAAKPPSGKPPAPEARHRDIPVAIREAFDVARRQLEDYARRKRGDIKRHAPADPATNPAK